MFNVSGTLNVVLPPPRCVLPSLVDVLCIGESALIVISLMNPVAALSFCDDNEYDYDNDDFYGYYNYIGPG